MPHGAGQRAPRDLDASGRPPICPHRARQSLDSDLNLRIGGCVMSAASGWYPDPNVPGQLRYFDGTAWTPHTAPGRTPAPAQPKRRHRSPLMWIATGAGIVIILSAVLGAIASCAANVSGTRYTCEGAEQDAVRISSENDAGSGLPLLIAVQDLRVVRDLQPIGDLPASGYAPVLDCSGNGTWSDGTESPIDLLVTIDSRGRYFVEYRPR